MRTPVIIAAGILVLGIAACSEQAYDASESTEEYAEDAEAGMGENSGAYDDTSLDTEPTDQDYDYESGATPAPLEGDNYGSDQADQG